MIRDIRGHPRLLTTVELEVPDDFNVVRADDGTTLICFRADDSYIEKAGEDMEKYFAACKNVRRRCQRG